MKIVTLNCFLSPWSWKRKNRLSHLVKALVDERPDIIFLQEVFFKGDAGFIVKNLFQSGFVDFFYSKTLLIVSKYKFTSRAYQDFKPHFSCNILLFIIELLNWIYGKGYQIVEINFDNQHTYLVNTHLLSAYGLDYGFYQKSRLQQLVEICNCLKNKLHQTRQVIFSGDFNFDINSSSYKVITNYYGFTDPFQKVTGNTFSTDNLNRKFFLLKKINQRIDHVFIKGFEQFKTFGQIIFCEPYFVDGKKSHVSDHYGLALVVQ
jgi:endonuclease/exonuclease/phosphatase family metal-dependent hydrolase